MVIIGFFFTPPLFLATKVAISFVYCSPKTIKCTQKPKIEKKFTGIDQSSERASAIPHIVSTTHSCAWLFNGWIGSSKQKNTKILEFSSIKAPTKILGAHLSYDADKNNDANFFRKIRKIKTKLNLWQTRDLTLYGKSFLAKTLGASRLIYSASMMSVPLTVIDTAQSLFLFFLWKNKKEKNKRNVVCQPHKKGGLNFIHFGIMMKSLRLAWIGRLLSSSNHN